MYANTGITCDSFMPLMRPVINPTGTAGQAASLAGQVRGESSRRIVDAEIPGYQRLCGLPLRRHDSYVTSTAPMKFCCGLRSK